MAGLGFLGGLGTAVAAGQQGYDRAQERDYMNQQREFQKTQQKRLMDEQRREDELRTGMQGVPTTESVQVTDTSAPLTEQPVADDQMGPNPAAPQPTKSVTRQRNKDEVLADYAAMARKAGKMDLAMKFEDQADLASHQRAAATFQQWSSSIPDNASLFDVANQAKDIYNSDRLPGKVSGIAQNADGSVTVQMYNRATGQTIPRQFTSVEQLKQGMEGYFSPETYNQYIKSKRDAALKAQEKLFEPYTLKPGEKRQVYNPATGKVSTIGEGAIPAGFELLTDPNGNTILRKIDGGGRGAGTGAGGKGPKEDIDSATSILKDSLGKSDGSPEGAQRYSRAVSYLDGIYASNSNISPRTAAAIAADASADPSKITMQIDNRTGLVSKVYRNPDFDGGKPYNLAPNSASVAEMEKSVGPKGMQTAVTGMIDTMLEAAPAEQRDATRKQLIQIATNPTDRKAYLEAAAGAGKDVDALTRQLDLISKYGTTATKAKAGPGYTPDSPVGKFVGGMNYQPGAPDATSPAGKFAARQAGLAAQAEQKTQQRLANQQALSKQYQADKKTMDPAELVRKYNDADLPVADLRDLRSIKY